MIGIFSIPLYAGTMGEVLNSTPWVTSFSIGPVWASPGSTQTLNLTPDIVKTYTANSSTKTIADGEVFLGVQKTLSPNIYTHFGIAGALTSPVKVAGNIWDDADSTFNNYTYNYQVQHGHIGLKAKVFKDISYSYKPWVSGSVGVGFNRAYGFNNTNLIYEAIPQNNFANNIQTSFTYTVGAGVQKILNQNWQMGMGYEFADWGKSQLSRAASQTINSGLNLNHLYTNGLIFNLTYIA